MSEHLLFLQAAGSDFNAAHNLVAAVAEVIRTPYGQQASGDASRERQNPSGVNQGLGAVRPHVHPERLAERIERAGYQRAESLLLSLAVLSTSASPLREVDIEWIASAGAHVGDTTSAVEAAGVVFAFNTINRIADARRVRLEYRFLRELRPLRGWIERRLAWLTGLAYDLSHRYRSRQSSAELLDRVCVLFKRLGITAAPDVFIWLSRTPVVLEGVLEMIETTLTNSHVRADLLKEAIAMGVVSRAMPGSGLRKAVEQWLPAESLTDSRTLRAWAAPSEADSDSTLASACRRYTWQVANAAHTISDEQIEKLTAMGLSDPELLDLTLATAVFSALAIIEPISAALAHPSITSETTLQSKQNREVHVQMA